MYQGLHFPGKRHEEKAKYLQISQYLSLKRPVKKCRFKGENCSTACVLPWTRPLHGCHSQVSKVIMHLYFYLFYRIFCRLWASWGSGRWGSTASSFPSLYQTTVDHSNFLFDWVTSATEVGAPKADCSLWRSKVNMHRKVACSFLSVCLQQQIRVSKAQTVWLALYSFSRDKFVGLNRVCWKCSQHLPWQEKKTKPCLCICIVTLTWRFPEL